jgi:hypothetical protein
MMAYLTFKGGAPVNQSNQKDPKKGIPPTGKPTAAPGPGSARPQQNPAKKPMGK